MADATAQLEPGAIQFLELLVGQPGISPEDAATALETTPAQIIAWFKQLVAADVVVLAASATQAWVTSPTKSAGDMMFGLWRTRAKEALAASELMVDRGRLDGHMRRIHQTYAAHWNM